MDKPRDLTPLSEYATALTAWIIERNTENKKEPWFARLDEMILIAQEDFKETMRNLVRDKTLTYHPDLNGRMMFEFTQPK
ncbi:MAG: hypothetical protein HDS16_04795 [Bacteroides sp.]|nr:hypothetical protein [Bacteroides sp.]